MVDIVVPLPTGVSGESVCNTFVAMASSLDLDVKQTTLKKFPGSVHWHLKKRGERGTLEATWWPEKKRFWFSIHENRRAEWQDHIVAVMKTIWLGPRDQ